MIHVFLLMVYLGVGEDRRLISDNMYFRDLNECNYFAHQLAKRFGNYELLYKMDKRDMITSYCLPKYLKEGSVEVY